MAVITPFLYKTNILSCYTTYPDSSTDLSPLSSSILMASSSYKGIQINAQKVIIIVCVYIISSRIRQLACKVKYR